MKFVNLNARKGNNFFCVSNLSVYGNLIPGLDTAPKFDAETARVFAIADELKQQGYAVEIEQDALFVTDIEMLKEFKAI